MRRQKEDVNTAKAGDDAAPGSTARKIERYQVYMTASSIECAMLMPDKSRMRGKG